jgi:hypothetical protein
MASEFLSPDNMNAATHALRQISQREYAEDTLFFPLKHFVQFSARRRTSILFLSSALDPVPATAAYTWIDNTPTLFTSLTEVLSYHNITALSVNMHREIAFASGLHAGEKDAIASGLVGAGWRGELIAAPAMLAVEYVARVGPEERRQWYARLMETAWAMIGEAFSEKVIQPGRTTTEVSIFVTTICFTEAHCLVGC